MELSNLEFKGMKEIVRDAKLRLLKMHFESGVGHIGGNLSSLDLLIYLFHKVLKENDKFVLSKGHAAGSLYVALWSVGKLSDSDLQLFHGEGTKLSGHPTSDWIPEIDFSTGSLGHGLSLSIGLGLGKMLKSEGGHTYCLMSDGEWNEGSNWEALIFAAHNKLNNLTFIIDSNKLQGFGTTREVAHIESLADKFRSFGIPTMEIDGHSINEISKCFSQSSHGLNAVIANTKKGCGISFMENKMEWHYLPMSELQYKQALEEVSNQ